MSIACGSDACAADIAEAETVDPVPDKLTECRQHGENAVFVADDRNGGEVIFDVLELFWGDAHPFADFRQMLRRDIIVKIGPHKKDRRPVAVGQEKEQIAARKHVRDAVHGSRDDVRKEVIERMGRALVEQLLHEFLVDHRGNIRVGGKDQILQAQLRKRFLQKCELSVVKHIAPPVRKAQ